MNDSKIIELLRTGRNDSALNALYMHFPLLQKMIRSKGGTSNDAEDIFQEALIILIKKVRQDHFQLTAKLSTYLFSVCRFLWKDEQKKRRQPVALDPDTGPAGFDERELNAAVEEESRAQLAEKVLYELKDRCRELLIHFYEGRLRMKDIATRMGYSSENTAKNQKYKCLENAKNRLKELQQTTPTF